MCIISTKIIFKLTFLSLNYFDNLDRRGIVTPEYAAERAAERAREQESRDTVIANNKSYGTVITQQPSMVSPSFL